MNSTFWKDAAERVLWTFAQAFIGALVITQTADLGDKSMWVNAALAGVAAAASLIKSIIASRVGTKGTAQLGASTY